MKSPLDLVDPELRALVESRPQVTFDETILELARNTPAALAFPAPGDDRVVKDELVAPGRDGQPDVPMLRFRPTGAGDAILPCVYHIHGGGYVMGSAAGVEPLARMLVDALGCMIVTVDYRLAPETPFPGPLEDCYTGLVWLFEHAETLGIDPTLIGIRGESAGGGLAAALALLARDRGEVQIAFQQLIYPMIDDRTCTLADPHPHTGQIGWNGDSNRFGWRSYLGAEPGSDGISPYAATARATDLTGLPPAYISTGALDLFLEENFDYARRLTRAGVATEFHVYPGAFHGFEIDLQADVSARSRRDWEHWLARQLAG